MKLADGVAILVLIGVSRAQLTERVSVDSNGAQADFGGDLPGATGRMLSANGRYVAFMSPSTNLVPGDTNGAWDVFVRDRLLGVTERVSVDSSGAQGNGFSGVYGISISADGRFVAFESRAGNLVPGDTNGSSDVFVRDRVNHTTERVSVDSSGNQGNDASNRPSVSADGRFVAFQSQASNLVTGDSNGVIDVFVRDRLNGTTERVTVGMGGAWGNASSGGPSISADGRYVAYDSVASNLVGGDANGTSDVFVYDRQSGTTERVSVATGGTEGIGSSYQASISGDGRFVVFSSAASNLVSGDTNGSLDNFIRDRLNGTTERVSVASGGAQASGYGASVSGDGRYVAFLSSYLGGITWGIFVHDSRSGETDLVSVSSAGVQPDDASAVPSISPDGRYVSFRSYATNLVRGDTNANGDVFVHDRSATGYISMCEPGVGNVIACPCSNPSSGSGRGCDNSSSTGGASLSALGIAYLAVDSLGFTTNGEKPSATSILLQADVPIRTGIVFGQGVRCAGGTLKRLYIKIAFNGSINAPDFSAGDTTVSTRSAFLGDPILPGQSRFYLVYYRDLLVLGGCAASSTFNATQTGQVTWWP